MLQNNKFRLVAFGTVIGGSLITYHNRNNQTFSSIGRLVRTATIGITLELDYQKTKYISRNLSKEKSDELFEEYFQRAGTRVRDTCIRNGGVYIKLGQGLATFNQMFPRTFISTLSQLNDRAFQQTPNKIDQLFRKQFNCSPTDLFQEWNDKPIAAASLAQVYEATTFKDEKVAVKVQYFDLLERFPSDMKTVELLLKFIEYVHPKFGFSWVVNIIRRKLELEMDFLNEGNNCERCGRELGHLHYLRVPKIYWNYSTKRILTMEYIDGIKIDDVHMLKKEDFSLKDIGEKIVRIFGEQIFSTGNVHADPHPGNVFVRRNEDHRTEIVLLDHGLYEHINETLRIDLCHFWKSIVERDLVEMEKYSRKLGVEEYRLFAETLFMRPLYLDNKSKIMNDMNKMTKEEIELVKMQAQENFDIIMNRLLKVMPLELLLVFRNLNIVRSIVRKYDAGINRHIELGKIAINSLTDNVSPYFWDRLRQLINIQRYYCLLYIDWIRIVDKYSINFSLLQMKKVRNLQSLLKEVIKNNGPITISSYMKQCLFHPTLGFYSSQKEVFGKHFITSPELNSIFGEIVSVYLANEYKKLNGKAADEIHLIELGPGRGVLMNDILKTLPPLIGRNGDINVHLVEKSGNLQNVQKKLFSKLENGNISLRNVKSINWYEDVKGLPNFKSDQLNRLILVVANEYLDALPINIIIKDDNKWNELAIGLNRKSEKLEFVQNRKISLSIPQYFQFIENMKEKKYIEIMSESLGMIEELIKKCFIHSNIRSSCLFIDYGHDGDKVDTFRAYHENKQISPLEKCGECDLTADVDFSQIRQLILQNTKKVVTNVEVSNLESQKDFLCRFGLIDRTRILMREETSKKKKNSLLNTIETFLHPDKMGTRFKIFTFRSRIKSLNRQSTSEN
ncbi:hypothetical protein SNEBB_009185 [Seison nebaliae]|nr:hypothetical protein SNEBB_009185 [Seison nebaliae]